jgi:hypothetical protein
MLRLDVHESLRWTNQSSQRYEAGQVLTFGPERNGPRAAQIQDDFFRRKKSHDDFLFLDAHDSRGRGSDYSSAVPGATERVLP